MPGGKKLEQIINDELKHLSDQQLDELASFARYLRIKGIKAGLDESTVIGESIREYTSLVASNELKHLEEEFAGYQSRHPKK